MQSLCNRYAINRLNKIGTLSKVYNYYVIAILSRAKRHTEALYKYLYKSSVNDTLMWVVVITHTRIATGANIGLRSIQFKTRRIEMKKLNKHIQHYKELNRHEEIRIHISCS